MEESISYFMSADTYEPAEMQADDFTARPLSCSQAIVSDHCYGLPYQDHNYGAVLSPSAAPKTHGSRSGRSHASGGPQAARPVGIKHPPPSLERGVEHLESFPPDAEPSPASPVFFPFAAASAAFAGSRRVVPFQIFKTESEVEVSTAPAFPPPPGVTLAGNPVGGQQQSATAPFPADRVSHSYAAVGRPESARTAKPRPQQRRPRTTCVAPAGAPDAAASIQPTYFCSSGANSYSYKRYPTFCSATTAASGVESSRSADSAIVSPPQPQFEAFSAQVAEQSAGFVPLPLTPETVLVDGRGCPGLLSPTRPTQPPKRPGRPRGAKSGTSQSRTPKRHRRANSDFVQLFTAHGESAVFAEHPFTQAPQPPVTVDADITTSRAGSAEANPAAVIVQSLRETAARPRGSDDSASIGFGEAYRNLYERLFKQLGVGDEEPIDMDTPVGASRSREQLSRLAAAAAAVAPAPAPSASRTELSPALLDQASNTDTDDDGEQSDVSDKSESSDSSIDPERDEWRGERYTTSCLCGMTHNDEFMIQCDRCEVWQHCDCMGLRKKSVPDQYLCHLCQPRELKLSRDQARRLQTRKLRGASSRGRKRAGRAAAPKKTVQTGRRRRSAGDKRRERAAALRNSDVVEEFYANFIKIEHNEYAPDVLKALRSASDNAGCGLLEQVPVGAPCLVMYVKKERRGLVANVTIPPGQPVAEFRGRVCLVEEFSGRDADGRVLPYILFYRGLAPALDICVDSRFRGTDARFARRSCQPNTQVKHLIKDGELHFLLVATELIESATEITIPFDYDYRLCKYEVECACKILGNADCPVQRGVLCWTDLSCATSSRAGPKKRMFNAPKRKASEKVKTGGKKGAVPARVKVARVGLKVKLKRRTERTRSPALSIPKAGRRRATSMLATFTEGTSQRRSISERSVSEERASVDLERSPPVSREEKKIRQLMEQIERMEQRERRKLEKKGAIPKEVKGLEKDEIAIRDVVDRHFDTVDVTEDKNETNDITGLITNEHALNEAARSYTQFFTAADLERNVAKKRWLRQALCDESASRSRLNSEQAEESIMNRSESTVTTPACGSLPPPKKRFFSASPDEEEATDVTKNRQGEEDEEASIEAQESAFVTEETVAFLGKAPADELADAATPEPARKKVKMSLDEYKKRKRASDGVWPADVAPEQTDESFAPGESADASKPASSFIPQLKESDIMEKSLRLGSLPDPAVIGKCSTTLDDLRRRIYGRSFADQPPIAAQNAEEIIAEQQLKAKHQIELASESALEQPEHRMSLMDRLKNEFGVDDHA